MRGAHVTLDALSASKPPGLVFLLQKSTLTPTMPECPQEPKDEEQ